MVQWTNSLVLRPTRVHVLVPQQDPARHALHVLEALLPEDLRELHAPRAAAAVHDHFLILMSVELGHVLRDLLERDQLGTLDVRDLILIRQSAIDERELLTAILQ